MQKIIIAVFLGLMILASCTTSDMPGSVKIKYDGEVPQALFAIDNISKACKSKKIKVMDQDADKEPALMINMIIDPALGFEAYRIDQLENSIVLAGGDANGLMYAGIDLTEMILLGKDLQSIGSIVQKPYIRHRGLRYNIPLDARTPSYDDTGDAAQKNIETMWEWDFWKQYLDHMALNRYNLLTIWSLHPYPSWIRVPEYPEVALANVTVYNKPINNWTDMKWKDEGIQEPENLTVIREMSVEEKTEHWKKVFQYAEDRGIDIYLFHWNVFVNGAEGKHGIRWQQDHPITVDYIRKSIKQTLLTFPNIKGIGVTAGEHINRELTGKYKTENWMWHTYGQGIMDARAENPDLDVRFIFRRHWSNLEDIAEAFKDYPTEIETSFKYSRAHMYSSTKPPWFVQIQKRAKGWVDEGTHPALAILATRKGIIFLHEAIGRLTPEPDSPHLPHDAIFPITSISKPITATAAMILVEDGLLGLNRPVREYIPEFEGEGKEQVMVHHLLTHTAGIDDETTWAIIDEKEKTAVDVPAHEDTQHPTVHRDLCYGFDVPLSRKPGIEMSYCNYGYWLLGEIIRRVSAQSLDSFASERIFKPLGMENTWYSVPESVSHRIIQRPPDAPYPEYNDEMYENPSASSGVYSTALDMAVFGQMFLNQGCYGGARVLSPVTVAAMTRNQIPGITARYLENTFPEASWGLGWSINAVFKGEVYGEAILSPSSYLHSGSTGVLLWIDPVRDLVGVYFSALMNFREVFSPTLSDRTNWRADLFMNMVTASSDDL